MSKTKKPEQLANQTNQRPPIVVVMGHVDHGKTSLLDAIRATNVASREHGGITQSIGAYQITLPDHKQLTFIDTPGHLAFTKMRSHGAKVADIAILVVAANDSVMPQTIESIKIIKDAKIPYVVVVNKIDLPDANFDKVVQDLLRHEVLLENYGGDVPVVKVSAKTKSGVQELIELLELISELKEIKGNPMAPLEAVIIESKLDKNKGPVASVIVRSGSLKVGDKSYIDGVESKIRGLFDYQLKPITEALPGMPVEIIGLSKVPQTGAAISLTPQSEIALSPTALKKTTAAEGTLNIVLKTDTNGSLDAIAPLIPENVHIIGQSVGQITPNDILLAKDTKSILIGFNVVIDASTKKLSEDEKVIVRLYRIIYELLEELQDAAAGILEIHHEETLGKGQILASFPFEKMKIAGTKVLEGRLARGDTVKVMRAQLVLGETKIKSLRIGKEESNKAEVGKECGLLLDPQVEFTPGDIIEAYKKY